MADPIETRLTTSEQVAAARLQDSIVEALVSLDDDIILHGGTAIWRCYNGNRFSEDVDIYATDSQMKNINNNLSFALSKRGVNMDYSKYVQRVIGIFNGSSRTKLEAMRPKGKIKTEGRQYEKTDGSKIMVRTLSIEDFISEKIATYKKRRFIRDMYDIYHLAQIEPLTRKSKTGLKGLINHIESPVDGQNLGDIVYAGIAPSFEVMLNTIKAGLE